MSSGIGLALMQLASVPGLPYPPCGALAAALGQMTQPKASQRLSFGCEPLGWCQGGAETRLNQPQARILQLRAPISTKMVLSASVASVAYVLLLKATSEHQRPAVMYQSHPPRAARAGRS